MIDWYSLFANSLWVMALAIALAASSHASWQAYRTRQRYRSIINRKSYQLIFCLAGVLFCTAMALTASSAWLSVAWFILGIASLAVFLIPLWGKP